MKEGVPIAHKYNGRSVAEQNSLDLSWNLLMSEPYELLRAYLFPRQNDLVRFRQLVVNSVMATDIVSVERVLAYANAFHGVASNTLSRLE